ncbi:hypothetical protein Pyn_36329 [Prunus yedoensis var. nudiflora]|uniref:Uncharacterized protein n=1 Tax=Prunus yedoensis var. nudiflora TaxID=2094558 RepID=A0A314YN46_PRUYE|nr:hypothetical protein Pyn_36329 [Prunus yedoensis var. nudiflora]
MAKVVTLGTDAAGQSQGRHSGQRKGRHSGHGFSQLKAKSSLKPWPRPLLWVQIQPGEVMAVTLAMDATRVLGQMNMAKLELSYQTLPSSSIALQFLLGLIGKKAVFLQGWEGISVASWFLLTSTFQDERQLVDSRRREPSGPSQTARSRVSVDMAPWFWKGYNWGH